MNNFSVTLFFHLLPKRSAEIVLKLFFIIVKINQGTTLMVFTLINPVSLSSPRFLKTYCFQLRPKDPGAPLGPGGPWLPRAPASPLFPGEPAGPEGPLGPLGPWGPWLPGAPAFPGGPAGPESPWGPLGPGRPCLPPSPSSPLFPRGPMGPSGPWLPGDPVAPAGPADPGFPGIPGIPGAQKQALWPQDPYGDVCWVPWTVWSKTASFTHHHVFAKLWASILWELKVSNVWLKLDTWAHIRDSTMFLLLTERKNSIIFSCCECAQLPSSLKSKIKSSEFAGMR